VDSESANSIYRDTLGHCTGFCENGGAGTRASAGNAMSQTIETV